MEHNMTVERETWLSGEKTKITCECGWDGGWNIAGAEKFARNRHLDEVFGMAGPIPRGALNGDLQAAAYRIDYN